MIKVLIADDQELILDGLKMILDLENSIEVIATAKNGLECLEKSKDLNPDLILMDIRMPKMDGIEATKKIKEFNSDIKIIALTTFNDKRSVKRIFEYGADGYVLKDIDSDSLINIIGDKIQTFITTTEIKDLSDIEVSARNIFRVNKGQIKKG